MPVNPTDFNYQISASDFSLVAARPFGINEDAQIHPEMSFSNFQLKPKGRGVSIADVDINITLISNDCWMLSSQAGNNDLLKHEQGHYDIIAISAREMYKALHKLTAISTDELQKKVDALKEKLGKRTQQVDARYDIKTNHSLKIKVQQKWDQKIAAEKQKSNGSINNLPK